MNIKPLLIVNATLIAAMLGLSLWIEPMIADNARLPVHWDLFSGEPDRYGSKWEALLAMPLVSVALTLLFVILPYFDPRRRNLEQSAKLWNAGAIGVVALLAGLHVFLVLGTTGPVTGMKDFLLVGAALLFIVLGNYLGKTRPNWFAGVRTPWTMSSDYSWEKTHRWAARLFVATGAITLIVWLFAGAKVAAFVMIALIAATAVVSFVLSYIYWRNDPDRPADANGGA